MRVSRSQQPPSVWGLSRVWQAACSGTSTVRECECVCVFERECGSAGAGCPGMSPGVRATETPWRVTEIRPGQNPSSSTDCTAVHSAGQEGEPAGPQSLRPSRGDAATPLHLCAPGVARSTLLPPAHCRVSAHEFIGGKTSALKEKVQPTPTVSYPEGETEAQRGDEMPLKPHSE